MRMTWMVAGCGVLVVVAAVLAAVWLGESGDDFATRAVEKHGSSESLVVLLHAVGGDPERLTDVKAMVRQQLPNADILSPAYVSSPFANTDPLQLAAKLDRRLENLVEGADYKQIVIVGHSLGALLARRSYLYGKGFRSDHPNSESRQLLPTTTVPLRRWTERIERIILLAGMNRGWDLTKIDNRTWTTQIQLMLGVGFARLTGIGKLALSVERGAPFIGNLRIDWIRMTRNQPDTVAPVLQMLGERDDLVTPGDDLDAITAPNFIFVRVDAADHNSIRQMSLADPSQRQRAEAFASVLTEPIGQLRSRHASSRKLLEPDPSVRHLVFIKHGIRDMADWSSPLRTELERAGGDVHVVIEKFPYFSMMSFLLLWDRQREVRRFVDEYASYLAKYPNADKISFVGHSFGTYILASALERYRSIAFHRLYFAGSVVRRGYDWPSHTGRFEQIRNDRAGGDWVVAIFPRLFEQIRDIPAFSRVEFLDVGSAGFNGFIHDVASRYDFKYLGGGHGAALDFDANRQQAASIASFVLASQVENAIEPAGLGDQHSVVALLGQLAWAVWLLLAVSIVGLGYWIWRAAPMSLRARRAATLAYALVVLFVLNTF